MAKYRNEFPAIRFPRIFGDSIWEEFPFTTKSTWTWNGQWVDTSKYDIVPKPDYRKSLADEKQKEIDRLDKERKRLEAELKELNKD